MDYPIRLFKSYADRKIDRATFIQLFTNWQIKNQIDYRTRGYCNAKGVYVKYRGIKARVCGNVLAWSLDGVVCNAKSMLEFRRKVDLLQIREVRR